MFNSKTVTNGGEGSGNFDHDGRLGEIGGSSSNLPQHINIDNITPVEFSQNDIEKFKAHGSVQKYYNEHILHTSITHDDERLGQVFLKMTVWGKVKI